MQPVDASVVIAPLLEPVVRGRRVAVLGDATSPLGPALLERGARLVHVYDPDSARVAQVLAQRGSSRTLMTAPLPEGDVAVRDGAFDNVVVPDLTLFESVDSAVARARKLVSVHGHALFASPNPDWPPPGLAVPHDRLLSYYELYDVIALQFPEVRMLGQAPFVGYVVADFAPDGEPDVVVDTSLVDRDAQEPRWFLALGTHQPRRLDAYTIIQVPTDLGRVAASDGKDPANLRDRIKLLERELEETKSAVPIVPRVGASTERVEALEASLREKEEALRRAEARAGDNHVRAGQLEGKVRDLEDELRHQRDRAFRLSNELEAEKKQRTKAELELRMVRSKSDMPPASEPELDKLRTQHTQSQDRIAQLEEELVQSRKRLSDTERDLAAARDELADLRASKGQSDARVVELMAEVAGRDARIEELDATVVDLQEAAGDESLEIALQDARRERDAARRAIEGVRVERDEAVAHATSERDVIQRSLEAAEQALRNRDEEIASLREAGARVSEKALADARRERDEAKAALEAAREEQERDLLALESTLRERGREVQRLHGIIANHEQLVRELVDRLETETLASSRVGDGEMRRQVHELSAAAARREGELQHARWRIAELEQKVRDGEAGRDGGDVTEMEHALFAAQNELDAMRQALLAERDARLRAERAAGLGDAQEQAVLEAQAEAEPPAS